MSHDPDDAPFVVAFPLPFRVLFLAGLGVAGWAANLQGLHRLGVDAPSALNIRAHDPHEFAPLPIDRRQRGFKSFPDPSSLYSPIYRLSGWYAAYCFMGWALYRAATQGNPSLVDPFKFIPAVCVLGSLLILLLPHDAFQKRERDAFLLSVRRCLFSPFSRPTYFCDIIFADIFTSYAKVLGDVYLSLLMLLPGGSLLTPPSGDGWSRWILPTLMSLPYLARFRQCIIDYMHPSNTSSRPFFNALKYASSFPVIYLSAAQRLVVSDLVAQKGPQVTSQAWHGEHALFRLWLLSALVNSLYSFWWDVTNDWGFDLLRFSAPEKSRPSSLPRPLVLPALHERAESVTSASPHTTLLHHSHASQPHPWGLRTPLLFPLPVYPVVIFLDLVLRLTWGVKLSSHLHGGESAPLIFWVEVAELVRRWLWVFVRVEWEVVRRAREGARREDIDEMDGIDGADERYEMMFDSGLEKERD
ncbi:EXS-domain-containing protein [Dentipellis sp. KUC8613]|nr:EXS-domain-containing protein [Dentipellis sp. KUC8613]